MNLQQSFQLSPPAVWPLLAAVFAAAVAWQFLALRTRVPAVAAFSLAALRAGAVGTVLFLAMDPSLFRQRTEKFSPTIAVAVDDSLSMGLRGDQERTRLERASDFLSSPGFEKATEGYFTELYTFSEALQRAEGGELEGHVPSGRWSDLPGALDGVVKASPPSLGAIVVLTDGGGGDDAVPPALLGRKVPVVIVGVGQEEETRDVEVVQVETAGLAFAGKPVRITVLVRARGFAGRKFPLLLKESGRAVLSEEVTIEGSDAERRIDLTWMPPRPGTYHLSVEVPLQAGEQVRENNRSDMALEVARDKIRILLVSGRPSWNHRFLRDAFKGDPTIDLISFIILRTATDAVNVPQEELSLIPFPTKKIFLEELSNFDLVIFENFSFRYYFPAQYLEKVKEFVDQGGGFWMFGGALSFGRGGYAGTPIQEILPLELPDLIPESAYVAGPFRPRLTPAGERHPFFQGLAGDFDRLPLLEGYNPAGTVRVSSVVLADHELEDGSRQPLIVTGRYGTGRTLAFLSDSLWKWNFESVGKGLGNYFYLSFLRQAVRWSVGDPRMQPVVVRLDKERVAPGEKVGGTVRVLGEDYLPAESLEMEVTLRGGDGGVRVIPARRESPGLYAVEAVLQGAGTYEIAASVKRGGEFYAGDRAVVEATWPAGEYSLRGTDRKSLEALGARLGGGFLELAEGADTAAALRGYLTEAAPVYRALLEEKKRLGDEWWTFAVLLAFLGAEWSFRRRRGLD